MKTGAFSRIRLLCVTCILLAPGVAQAHMHIGTYNLLIVPVDFADDTGTLDVPAFRSDWLTPLLGFYNHMSMGQLNINVTLVEEVIRLGNRNLYHPCTLPVGCLDLWNGDGNPLKIAMGEGYIAATPAGLAPPDGGPDSVFDGILFLTAQRVRAGFPGWAIAGQRPSIDTSTRRYPMGHASMDPNRDGDFDPGEFGVAAHELGHMISGAYTHPAGYVSAYELMDSCYPCALGIFPRVDRSALTGSFIPWFSGWMPAASLVTFTPPVSGWEILAPIELSPGQTTAPQGIQVLTGANYSYILECRRFIPPDDLIPTWPDRPEAREGVLILKATPGADPETWLMLAPGYLEHDRWESSFVNGQTFTDPDRDISIRVQPLAGGDGHLINVNYGPGATAPVPDVGMIPWLSPPMNTYETVDIWVDSPANGFERDAPHDPNRLRYGRRTDPERTVIGNGDDPCANETNLVYARIRNLGTANATNVVVHFEVTYPLGVGIRDATGWTRFGTVTSAEFPGLASIAPGAFVDVCAPWRPVITFPPGAERLAFHSCLRVKVNSVTGELVTTNQDGDREQENVGWFEMSRPTITAPYEPINERIFLANGLNIPRDFYLVVDAGLPEGWLLDVGTGIDHYRLNPGEVRNIPVRLLAPPETPIGSSYFVDVRAHAVVEHRAPDGTVIRCDSPEVAGVLLAAQTVLKTTLSISASFQQTPSPVITVTGTLTPPITGAIVAIRYLPPTGDAILQTTSVDKDGKFSHQYTQPYSGRWKIRGLWQGDLKHAGAVSNEVPLRIGTGAPGGCFGSTTAPNTRCPKDMASHAVLFSFLLWGLGAFARRRKRTA